MKAIKAIFSSGFFTITRGKTPFRIHWTTPIGLFLFSGFSFNPLVWAALLLVMLVHELGHAFVARRYHMTLVSIDVTAVGGGCRLAGDPSLSEAAAIAWGGVAAQAVLFVVALALKLVLPSGFLSGVFEMLLTTNAILIVLNLLPIEPLDGATAFRLFRR